MAEPFDDPERRYRTVYAARHQITAVRETLGEYRQTAATIALTRALEHPPEALVTARWRAEHVLAPVAPELSGRLLDLATPEGRHQAGQRFAEVLDAHGLPFLDLGAVTKAERAFTQQLSAAAYNAGYGSIAYPSMTDGQRCLAIMEGRGRFELDGPVRQLTDPAPAALRQVANEWNLELEAAPTDRVVDEPGGARALAATGQPTSPEHATRHTPDRAAITSSERAPAAALTRRPEPER